MRLSPLDIQHADFDSGLNGYNKRQVRDLLARVADQTEDLLRDNQSLKDELKKAEQRIEELQTAEVELKRTVIAAERIGNELKENAKREAELTMQDAEQRKEEIQRQIESRIRDAKAEIMRLEKEQELFREQFRGMLKAFERSLDNMPVHNRTKSSD